MSLHLKVKQTVGWIAFYRHRHAFFKIDLVCTQDYCLQIPFSIEMKRQSSFNDAQNNISVKQTSKFVNRRFQEAPNDY